MSLFLDQFLYDSSQFFDRIASDYKYTDSVILADIRN